MTYQRRKYHIHVGNCAHHDWVWKLLGRLHREVHIVGNFFVQIADVASQNQFLLRPSERHVQYTQILSARVLLHALCHHIFAHSLSLQAQLRVNVIHADAKLYIHQNAFAHIHLVKLFGEPADKANRKFKSFAFMNRHNAHHIRILIKDIGLAKVYLLLLYCLEIPYKMKQPVKTRILKRTCLL